MIQLKSTNKQVWLCRAIGMVLCGATILLYGATILLYGATVLGAAGCQRDNAPGTRETSARA